ncbi:class I SAM-dependent methyltransferase [Pedobacter gandavensis]|uniref:Methyltransferase domain-containing protein n=1 Tax=Pedobacter gandavensis TaxID=2679963 RepID=A0ABR6ERJ3_9SPHI|nr:class I SAM-dependent methyltransferase [Pedobacter gandavensis]MBB2147866.1 methyltransferase domain-containing protein [Pedobacter gandavensis]
MKIENPSFNYDKYGQSYAIQRTTDPRIAAYVWQALGNSASVLNVGAGSGSYEPEDRYVVAVEPSIVMRKQRVSKNRGPAVIAYAENLPFDDEAFEASMAMITIHHWQNLEKGITELRRVTAGPVVILTLDPKLMRDFWINDYFPEMMEVESFRLPAIDRLLNILGGQCKVESIPIPMNCIDGFTEAFYGRPEAFLSESVRAGQSCWGFGRQDLRDAGLKVLSDDLISGKWDKKYGYLRTQTNFSGCLKLITAIR